MHSGYKPVYLFLLILWLLAACKAPGENGSDQLYHYTLQQLEQLYKLTGEPMEQVISRKNAAEIRSVFLEGRNLYKKVEAATEYFLPATAKGINGPPVIEVETDEHREIEPTGLQVMETFIFPDYDSTRNADLLKANGNLHAMLYRAIQLWQVTRPSPKQWLDAAWYELIRIATLGITGFDTPGCKTGLQESALALGNVKMILIALNKTEGNLEPAMDKAIEILRTGKDFDNFDRASFLRKAWQPVFASVAETREKEGVLMSRLAISSKARSLFGDSFLNVHFFAPDNIPQNTGIDSLGKALFSDTRLSSTGTFSCASCHKPATFFADQNALSTNIHGNLLARNTPSLVNTAYQTNFFWDMRVNTLEMQAKSVIENKNEMNGNIDSVLRKLNADKALVTRFNSAFKKRAGEPISEEQITHALAAYQRTLTGFKSPFDDYMNGNDTAITLPAVAGFNLFMGKAKCATCHFAPVFSGLIPPYYDKMESEVIGVPANAANTIADNDEGRFLIYPVETYRFAFKTPSVRNTAYTFPYMHNGVYKTLEQVVDFYNNGGGSGLGLPFPHQTLSTDKLNLSVAEQQQLVAFIKTLDSKIHN